MREELARINLTLYRQLRASCTPEQTVERVREHVRMACMYASATGRTALAFELEEQESTLTQQLETIRVRQDWGGRFGAFWRTGQYSNPLLFRVLAYPHEGYEKGVQYCESPGCAVKHAWSMLQDRAIAWVVIRCNRDWPICEIDRRTTFEDLLTRPWPVD